MTDIRDHTQIRDLGAGTENSIGRREGRDDCCASYKAKLDLYPWTCDAGRACLEIYAEAEEDQHVDFCVLRSTRRDVIG